MGADIIRLRKSRSPPDWLIWLGGVAFGSLFMAWLQFAGPGQLPRPLADYNDAITLPVEAFGAHWRIKNFRKNVRYPNGLDEAMPRALAASRMFDRPTVITFAPRIYTLTRPIDLTGSYNVTLHGGYLDASQSQYAIIVLDSEQQ